MGLSFVGCLCVCFGGGPAAEKPHTPTLRPLAYFCGTAGAIYRAIRRVTQDSAPPSGTFGAVGCLWLGRGWIVVTFGGISGT